MTKNYTDREATETAAWQRITATANTAAWTITETAEGFQVIDPDGQNNGPAWGTRKAAENWLERRAVETKRYGRSF